jgi:hypothetical protein
MCKQDEGSAQENIANKLQPIKRSCPPHPHHPHQGATQGRYAEALRTAFAEPDLHKIYSIRLMVQKTVWESD